MSDNASPFTTSRRETGVLQEGDDWPGVFIRGDHAMGHVLNLERVLQLLSDAAAADVGDALVIQGVRSLRDLLVASVAIKDYREKDAE